MNNFKRERRGFGGGGFNRFDRGRSDRGRGFDKPMFDAVCDNCGQDCKVPFKPTGQRDVLCNECFRGEGHSDRKPRFDRKPQGGDSSARAIEQLNAKMERMLSMLEAIKASVVTEKPKNVLTVGLDEAKAAPAKAEKAKKPAKEKTETDKESKPVKAEKSAKKATKTAEKAPAKVKKASATKKKK